ncbi:hypothetical protein AB1N83_006999 [Pleurotus pulmonarius]
MIPNKRIKSTAPPPDLEREDLEADRDQDKRRKIPTRIPEGAVVITKSRDDRNTLGTPNRKSNEYRPYQTSIGNNRALANLLGAIWRVEAGRFNEGSSTHPTVRIVSPYTALFPPAQRQTNPHWGTRDTPPPEIHMPAIPCTTGNLPNLVFDEATIYGAVDSKVAAGIRGKAEELTAVIPFGAGNKLFDTQPGLVNGIKDFLEALVERNGEGVKLEVQRAAREGRAPHTATFAKPFTIIVAGVPHRIRTFLLQRQTFAFRSQGTPYAFFVADPDQPTKPWIIYTFKGDYIVESGERMKEALTSICRTIEGLPAARNFVNKTLMERRMGNTAEERMQMILSTMSLVYTERRREDGRQTPLWQLHGMPISPNIDTQREWLKLVRRIRFYLNDYTAMEPERIPFGCVWCKSLTHDGNACPLPDHRDWKGPVPDDKHYAPEIVDTIPTNKEGRRRGKGKGKGKGRRHTQE